jgi:glutathione S-transferase
VSAAPEITLHGLPPSHPSMAAEQALRLKGIGFERVEMEMGRHNEQMEAIYGAGNRTVPGMVVDGEPVHGSRAIFARLEEIAPEPALYPEPIAAAVREADRWGDEELQDLGRRLPWGALHFRPEALGTIGGGPTLDPAGTDFAIRFPGGLEVPRDQRRAARRRPRRAAGEARADRRARRGRRDRRQDRERRRPADRLDDPGVADARRPRAAAGRERRRADRPPLVP